MKKISIFIIGILLGGIVGGSSGLQIGYNLPREPTTEVNVSVDKLKAKNGGQIDFSSVVDAETNAGVDTLSRKERRKLQKQKKGGL